MLKVLFAQYNYKNTAVATVAEEFEAIEKITRIFSSATLKCRVKTAANQSKKIRQLAPEKSGNLPAIALTCYASVEDCERAVQAGFQEHFSKPIEIDGLIALIEKLSKIERSV